MIALIDCNNFYVSCERVFQPSLNNKPVIILSNNDGCVIARSNEVKKIGIPMGIPAFKIKNIISRNKIQVFSTNFSLYGDMSQRVINTIIDTISDIEIYSIDEVFINLTEFNNNDILIFIKKLQIKVKKWTGIPVSIGVGETKTLAKAANYIAKKYNQKGLFVINKNNLNDSLKKIPVGKVWGIGKKSESFLKQYYIDTAYELKILDIFWARHYLHLSGEKIIKELNSESCIPISNISDNKKSICTSRTFGKMISKMDDLISAIALYTSRCCEKLRNQNSCASLVHIFIVTNIYREDLLQHHISKTIKLEIPTNDAGEILTYIVPIIKNLYKKKYQYKKAGIIVSGLIPDLKIQYNLFRHNNYSHRKKLINSIDLINKKMGRDVIRYAVQGYNKSNILRQQKLSPSYTTQWNHLLKIKL